MTVTLGDILPADGNQRVFRFPRSNFEVGVTQNSYVFRIVAMVEQADTQAKYIRLETLNQVFDGLRLPAETTAYQKGVFSRHVLATHVRT